MNLIPGADAIQKKVEEKVSKFLIPHGALLVILSNTINYIN